MLTRYEKLIIAIQNKDPARIKHLLRQDSDEIAVNIQDANMKTPLHHAIDTMDVPTVQSFCKHVSAIDLDLDETHKHQFPPLTHFLNLIGRQTPTAEQKKILILILSIGCTFGKYKDYPQAYRKKSYFINLDRQPRLINKIIFCEALLRGDESFIDIVHKTWTIASQDLLQYLDAYKELFGHRRRITPETAGKIQTLLKNNVNRMEDGKLKKIYRILLNPAYVKCKWHEVTITDSNREKALIALNKKYEEIAGKKLEDIAARLQYHRSQLDMPITNDSSWNRFTTDKTESEADTIIRRSARVEKYDPNDVLRYLGGQTVFMDMLGSKAISKLIKEIATLPTCKAYKAYIRKAEKLLRRVSSLSESDKLTINMGKIVIGVIEETADEAAAAIAISVKGKEPEETVTTSANEASIAKLKQKIETMEQQQQALLAELNKVKKLLMTGKFNGITLFDSPQLPNQSTTKSTLRQSR